MSFCIVQIISTQFQSLHAYELRRSLYRARLATTTSYLQVVEVVLFAFPSPAAFIRLLTVDRIVDHVSLSGALQTKRSIEAGLNMHDGCTGIIKV